MPLVDIIFPDISHTPNKLSMQLQIELDFSICGVPRFTKVKLPVWSGIVYGFRGNYGSV